MVRLNKYRLPRQHHSKLQPRMYGPYRVLRRINNNAYVLKLPPDMQISSTFNVADLYKYFPPDAAPFFIENSGSNSSAVEDTDAGAL